MKKQILILVLILLGVIKQSNSFQKSKSQSKNKHKKYQFQKSKSGKVTKVKQDNGDDQKSNGFSEAENKEYQRVYSFKGYFRKVRNGQSDEPLTLKEITLNQYGIYVNEVSSITIDGLIDMIRLDELIDQDQVKNLKTQVPVFDDQIREIQMVQVGNKDESSQFPCFIIEDRGNDEEEWQICNQLVDEDNSDMTVAKGLIKFRSQIISKVIQNLEIKNSIKFTSSLLVSDDDAMGSQDGFEGWSYDKQELWQGKCQDSSSMQSPIDIISHEVLSATTQMQIMTHYHGDQDTIAVRGTNDYFLIGDFGYVIYQNEIEMENKYYCAWRIEFKYTSEHQIDGSDQQLEVLVYHKQSDKEYSASSTENGCTARNNQVLDDFRQLESALEERDLLLEHSNLVVSFLANPSASVTKETQGVFWQGLEMVDFTESTQPKDMKKFSKKVLVNLNPKAQQYMDTIADLEGLVDDGITQKFLHSFYYYTGSLSQPGCHDDVKRIVMYTPIDVAQSTYDLIQQKVSNGFNGKVNSRRPKNAGTNTMKGYQVFKHVDNSDKAKCSATEIIKKYEDPAFISKLSPKEQQSLEQLLANAKASRNRYSSILKNFEKITHEETTETETKEIQFNHEVNIKSVVKHVHKIPKKLLKKLFKKDKVITGEQTTLGQAGQQQLNVVLLGNSVKEYTQKASKQKPEVQQIIDNSDKNNIKLDKPNNVINQNNLSDIQKEKFASYLVTPDLKLTKPVPKKKELV